MSHSSGAPIGRVAVAAIADRQQVERTNEEYNVRQAESERASERRNDDETNETNETPAASLIEAKNEKKGTERDRPERTKEQRRSWGRRPKGRTCGIAIKLYISA